MQQDHRVFWWGPSPSWGPFQGTQVNSRRHVQEPLGVAPSQPQAGLTGRVPCGEVRVDLWAPSALCCQVPGAQGTHDSVVSVGATHESSGYSRNAMPWEAAYLPPQDSG